MEDNKEKDLNEDLSSEEKVNNEEKPLEEKPLEEKPEEAKEEAKVEETEAEEVKESNEEIKEDNKSDDPYTVSRKRDKKEEASLEEENANEPAAEEKASEDTKAQEEDEKIKSDVEKKIKKRIEKNEEKQSRLGFYRIGEYLKTEHKWENYLFVFVSVVTLVLGCLILNGALIVKDDFPLIGEHPKVFAWILIGLATVALIYALYPFYKPCFPEFRKISWLKGKDFLRNIIRTFVFILVLTALFILYDNFLVGLLKLIVK
jgi:preprotein translocase SecE subunit